METLPREEPEMRLVFRLRSLQETGEFGRFLGGICRQGDLILLSGELGAGKTALAGFIARGLGVPPESYVTSPSFSLMNRHEGRMPLYHIDCYRLEDEDDVEASGLIDYIVADGLTVIEWPDRLGSLLPPGRLEIYLTGGPGEERLASVTARGSAWLQRLQALAEEFGNNTVEREDNPDKKRSHQQ
jgi:tRNA threonylcarbamoyladenosine biosynthesis protein TsaE